MEYAVSAWRFDTACTRELFAGRYYSLALVARGQGFFRWGEQNIPCDPEVLLLLKPGAAAALDYLGGHGPLELLWVQLAPQTLTELSDGETDLRAAFNAAPQDRMAVRADSANLMLIKNLAQKLYHLPQEREQYAAALYEESLLQMFLVLVLRACIQAEEHRSAGSRRQLIMDQVFLYIRAHLTEELTLAQLESVFYVDRCHIAREFKRRTGQTVHQYIVKAKLDLCCRYIEQGLPITEVYQRGGFGGYSHFFRAFKKEYGMTPKQYYRAVQQGARTRRAPNLPAGPAAD